MNFKKLLEPSPKQVAKWEEIRAKGVWRFVFFWGVLRFGVPTFIVSAIIFYPFGYPGAPSWLRPAEIVLDFIIMCPFSGSLWGLAMWYWCEWVFSKHVRKV